MLMNRVSPATFCSSQVGKRRYESRELEYANSNNSSSSSSDHSSQFSQFSQTSFDLFPSQPPTYHPPSVHDKDDTRHSLSQHVSRGKQETPTDYFQLYMATQPPRASSSSHTSQRPSSSHPPQSSGNVSDSSTLTKSHYEQWKAEMSQKNENKIVIDTIVKVTKNCAKELGESLNHLQQSLADKDNQSSAVDALKQENSQLFDHQKSGFAEMLEGQVKTNRLLTEIIDRIDKNEAQLSRVETKVDLFVKSADEKFCSLHALVEKALDKLEKQTQCSRPSNNQDLQRVPGMSSECSPAGCASLKPSVDKPSLVTIGEKTTPQNTLLTNVEERRSVCLSSSPAQILTVNHCYSSQSGVDIDLSQMSPSVCGEIINHCLSGGSGSCAGSTRSKKIVNLNNKHVTQQQIAAAGHKVNSCHGKKSVKRFNPRTPVAMRTRGKRFRSKSISSDDEEHCHVTVTMKTMDVKQSVRRSKSKSLTPSSRGGRVSNPGLRKRSRAYNGDENAFLCSPPVHALQSNEPRQGCDQQIVQCRKEEQMKRLRINKSVLTGPGGDILKELQTALLPK